MGMELRVDFEGVVPPWQAVSSLLQMKNWPVVMRMIDGELAFPDEEPPAQWREIRVGAAGAMVSIRRSETNITLVAWGNADDAQLQLWHALAWAFAETGSGKIITDSGSLDASEFAKQATFPAEMKINQ